MIKTNLQKEVKKLCIDENTTLTELANQIGTTKQYVSRLLVNNNLVNKMFVRLVEELGYDIEIQFIKRGE
ncbi:MAG: XRE family transcriptional regulator [Oscillospiraceae bacterium]|nr:XRE family transcriptional regulator [Oscillospiraceae bacterium]